MTTSKAKPGSARKPGSAHKPEGTAKAASNTRQPSTRQRSTTSSPNAATSSTGTAAPASQATGRSAGSAGSANAAVFDLDRTLLDGGSGLVIQRHLRERGLGPDRDIPFAGPIFKAFEMLGETRLSMQLAKLAVRASKGWDVQLVAEAAEDIADELATRLQPYARSVIDEHLAKGDLVVIASTTPEHFVRPLARRLGIEHVVASNWRVEDGRYTGELDGAFVWGREKLAAVKAWAKPLGVSLKHSSVYSDSYFDSPLLNAAGHPHAVNPDARLTLLATLKGWPIRHLDKPDGVMKLGAWEVQELLRPFARTELLPNARFEIVGLENIPPTGGALLCANHRSYFDATVVSLITAKAGRSARFLGKKEVFDAPIVGHLAKALGGIRVDRGTGSDQPLEEAATVLRAGDLVCIMPEGTIPRGPAFFEPKLRGRWGAARLAAMSGVPVIPVGIWGTERVWPRSSRLPKLDLTSPPTITVRIGAPFLVAGKDTEADTELIMSSIVNLLPAEARKRRLPTEEELRLTYPPGYKGDPSKETVRRPGRDR
jgi:putative phosphoserine phosphatase / 1-acylglycerol-3-phosphate O-acyltransferase